MIKFPKNIPIEIKAIIEKIDINREIDNLPNPSWDTNIYQDEIQNIFPDFIVSNDTSFDYGRSYIHTIYKTKNKTVLQHSTENNFILAKDEMGIESIGVSISAISNYILITYAIQKENEFDPKMSYKPMTEWHQQAEDLIIRHFMQKKFKPIDADLAFTELPEITTENTEIGETRVQDCLF